mmetsp:Transcript_8381/g.15807  ORF Transcript_8381/g.15807 Transcript_8381/m.15807 type:complete len:247 (+) Transcript_8381:98-838(+)
MAQVNIEGDRWTHRLGTLAWAPLPSDDNDRTPQKTAASRTSNLSLAYYNEWPCILYPSWSNAMRRSGLITDEKTVRLMGCKKSIAVEDLGENRVPSRLALGSGQNGSKYRPKVVAYYLGYSGDPAWGSVNVENLKQYTLDSCVEIIREMNVSCERSPSKDCALPHERLIHAMYEASIVMERPDYDPSQICRKFGFTNLRQGGKAKDCDDQELEQIQLTPEYFDDWRVGGDSHVDTQTQPFSVQQNC